MCITPHYSDPRLILENTPGSEPKKKKIIEVQIIAQFSENSTPRFENSLSDKSCLKTNSSCGGVLK